MRNMDIRKRRWAAGALLIAAVFLIPMQAQAQPETDNAAENPVIISDDMSGAGRKVTWSCIWFGSYPQNEVRPGSELYKRLEKEKGWSASGDLKTDGVRYRRLVKENAIICSSSAGYYDWGGKYKNRYFVYAPVKWRILSASDGRALLLSDRIIDCRPKNEIMHIQQTVPALWSSGTLRSWLNGYGASANAAGISYEADNFRNTAFSKAQMALIAAVDRKDETVSTDDKGSLSFQEHDTVTDSIFTLSLSEISGSTGEKYGFFGCADSTEKEKTGAEALVTDYARAKGVWSAEEKSGRAGIWWLASETAENPENSAWAGPDGIARHNGIPAGLAGIGVRPALTLNLSASSGYRPAGTVSSDGTAAEPEKKEQIISTPAVSYSVSKGTKSFLLHAVTDGDGRLTYSSSDSKTVSVSRGGKVEIRNYGIAVIHIHAAETLLYDAADGTVVVSVTPKAGKIKSAKSPSSRTLALCWKKDGTVSGYQLQISKNRDFSRETFERFYKKEKTRTSLTGLPSGNVYYVRIRAYKRVKKNVIYGKWSVSRRVRVKGTMG